METRSGRKLIKVDETILKSELKQSLSASGNEGPVNLFYCDEPDCNKAFKKKLYLERHIRDVHCESIECPIDGCDVVLKPICLKVHINGVHKKMKKECDNCGKKISYTNLNKHFDRCKNDGSKIIKCKVKGCKKTFRASIQIFSHMWSVHTERIECPIPNCKSMFKKASLTQHIRLVHDKMKEDCTNCGKKVPYGKLSTHLQLCTNNGSRPFECTGEDCPLTFRTARERASHIWNVHNPPVPCTYANCDSVVKKGHLPRHIKMVHERGFRKKCSNCGKVVTLDYLIKHMQTCTSDGTKNFKCTEKDCKSAFRAAHELRIHIRGVHESRPVECPFPDCNAMLKKTSLPQHVKMVHEKLKEECIRCGKNISYGNLNPHLKKYCKGNRSLK